MIRLSERAFGRMPDGRDVVFVSNRNGKAGIWRSPIDGSTPARLFYQPQIEPFEALVSPDMKWLIYRTAPNDKFPRDIIAVSLIGERKEQAVVASCPEVGGAEGDRRRGAEDDDAFHVGSVSITP